jgi:hypothetical protein
MWRWPTVTAAAITCMALTSTDCMPSFDDDDNNTNDNDEQQLLRNKTNNFHADDFASITAP